MRLNEVVMLHSSERISVGAKLCLEFKSVHELNVVKGIWYLYFSWQIPLAKRTEVLLHMVC